MCIFVLWLPVGFAFWFIVVYCVDVFETKVEKWFNDDISRFRTTSNGTYQIENQSVLWATNRLYMFRENSPKGKRIKKQKAYPSICFRFSFNLSKILKSHEQKLIGLEVSKMQITWFFQIILVGNINWKYSLQPDLFFDSICSMINLTRNTNF